MTAAGSWGGEQSGSAKRGLDVGYHQRCRKAFTGRIGDSNPHVAAGKGHEVEAITAKRAHLPAAGIVSEPLCSSARNFHEPFLQAAGYHPVLADVHYYRFGNHLCASVYQSRQGAANRHRTANFFGQKLFRGHVENRVAGSDYPMNAAKGSVKQEGA
jgi:hypothetical protein